MGVLLDSGIMLAVVAMTSTAVWLHTNNLALSEKIEFSQKEVTQLREVRDARQAEVDEVNRQVKLWEAVELKKRKEAAATARSQPTDAALPRVLVPEMACVEEGDPDILQLNKEIARHTARVVQLRAAAGTGAPPPNPFGDNLDKTVKVGGKLVTADGMMRSHLESQRPSDGLYQFTYHLPKKTSVPMLGRYWYPEMDRSCNTDYARVLGEDPMIALGNTSSCKVIDVVWQRQMDNRCAVVHRQPCQWSNYKYDDSSKDQTFGASSALSYPLDDKGEAEQLRTTPPFAGYPGIAWRDAFLPTFLSRKHEVVQALIKLIGVSGQSKYSDSLGGEPIVVMNTNHGHAGLVINFFCLLKSQGIPAPRHVIFTTDPALRDRFTVLGLTSFYHEGLGKYPKTASVAYGDSNFGKQMNMKQFCVYVTLLTGHDVLFQDVDVFWLQDPVPALQAQSVFHHFQFMDDGARTFRFSPLFANSGFFYIKNHPTSIRFWDLVTMHMAFGQTGNQEVVNPVLEYYAKRRGLKPRSLSPTVYMSGMHISPKGKSALFDKNLTEVIHFCWTHNFDSKFEKIFMFGKLRVSKECLRDIDACKFGPSGQLIFGVGSDVPKLPANAATQWYDRCDAL
eukprot:m.49825 g.49825  ORF g.49825 m.49825 type:complete len:620 (+) comp16205_c1_seq1:255-2114(+)